MIINAATGMKHTAVAVVSAATAVIVLLHFLCAVPVTANDDTFVYFTYARGMLENRPFCYDGRNIPSEGFTSLIYLLLLIPFEAAKVNLMFAGVLLNVAALMSFCLMIGVVLRIERLIPTEFIGPVSVVLFGAIALLDKNSAEITGRALETMLGPAAYVFALLFVALARHAADYRRERFYHAGFLTTCFLSFLIRPENILPLAAVGVLLLFLTRSRKMLLAQVAVFCGVLLLYHLAKLWYFGDMMPTGYYRKMHATVEGRQHVKDAWMQYRALFLCGVGMCAFQSILPSRFRSRPRALFSPAVAGLMIGGVAVLLFFNYVTPLIAYAFRYLFLFVSASYALAVIGAFAVIVALIDLIRNESRLQIITTVAGIALLPACYLTARQLRPQQFRPITGTDANVGAKSRQSTDQHLYVKLGRHLHDHISDSHELTLVFGDAGAVPYMSRCRFIDSNGLTEPGIARLFRFPEGSEKARRFAGYVLSWDPDVIVAAFGPASNGRVYLDINAHSPFRDFSAIHALQEFRKAGYRYLCSIRLYSDIHLLSKQGEPSSKVNQAFLQYAQTHGYVLPGLTVFNPAGSVRFEHLN